MLYQAAAGGHVEQVRFLLEVCGANPSRQTRYGWAPLHWAAANSKTEVVRVERLHHHTRTHAGPRWIWQYHDMTPTMAVTYPKLLTSSSNTRREDGQAYGQAGVLITDKLGCFVRRMCTMYMYGHFFSNNQEVVMINAHLSYFAFSYPCLRGSSNRYCRIDTLVIVYPCSEMNNMIISTLS